MSHREHGQLKKPLAAINSMNSMDEWLRHAAEVQLPPGVHLAESGDFSQQQKLVEINRLPRDMQEAVPPDAFRSGQEILTIHTNGLLATTPSAWACADPSWARAYILFHDKRHPSELGLAAVTRFLEHVVRTEANPLPALAQARSALDLMYAGVGKNLGELPQPRPGIEILRMRFLLVVSVGGIIVRRVFA